MNLTPPDSALTRADVSCRPGGPPLFYPCWFDGLFAEDGTFAIENHDPDHAPVVRGLGQPGAPGRWRWDGVGILDEDRDYTMHGRWMALAPAAPVLDGIGLDTLPCPTCITVPLTIVSYPATPDEPAAWSGACAICLYDADGLGEAPTLRNLLDGTFAIEPKSDRWNDVHLTAWTRMIVAVLRGTPST